MIEQRRSKRAHLFYYIRVYDRNTKRLFGHAVDLSEGGMMIMSDEPIKTNTRLNLALEDTLDIDGDSLIDFDAECRWCNNDFTHALYDAGVKFVSPSEKIKELVHAYI